MKFRTEIKPEKSVFRINYETSLFFTGSCFSEEIGSYLKRSKFDIIINPFGVLYNPVSVANSLTQIIEARKLTVDELHEYNGSYFSFSHDTSFSSASSAKTLEIINSAIDLAERKLKKANYLFVTFGTARTFRLKSSGETVSNCHKLPAAEFIRELIEVDDIVKLWEDTICRIRTYNKDINIIFTVSPVRHWKDGAHGNQLSKSVLFVAIEKLLSSDKKLSYFPSYELVMDDLRDYRYYNRDLLHPSPEAVQYIWEYFSEKYLNRETLSIYSEIDKIISGREHRISRENRKETRLFKENMLSRIESLSSRFPGINLTEEKEYFQNL